MSPLGLGAFLIHEPCTRFHNDAKQNFSSEFRDNLIVPPVEFVSYQRFPKKGKVITEGYLQVE